MRDLINRIEAALGTPLASNTPMSVGFGLIGMRATLADGREIAIKAIVDPQPAGEGGSLALEASMLRDLAQLTDLPVPQVYHADDQMLVMAWIDNDGGAVGQSAQRHAAELLAALHAVSAPDPNSGAGSRFGYQHDTLIGPLHQPNPWTGKWLPFFRDQRLMYMAHKAHAEGQLPTDLLRRLEKLAGRLDDYLVEPAQPSLVHGDLWGGNVLVKGGQIAGLIDPAIYYADREIELAFTTLFGTFGDAFFDAYQALAPLQPGFHESRRDLYNLYPLLVHVRLFGASYLPQINQTLVRLGL